MTMPWPAAAAALLCAAAGFAGGYSTAQRMAAADVERLRGDIARIEAQHADDLRALAEAASARMASAQDAERRALAELDATRRERDTANRKLKDALYALPTADDCGLSGAARRLLNDAIASDGAVSARAAEPAATHAAAAADAGIGEADLGRWIADAAALYAECRARIDAIRQWDDAVSGDHGR